MKVEIKLDASDVKRAISRYVTDVLRLNCSEDDVLSGYSWDTPKVTIDVPDKQTQEATTTTTATNTTPDHF